MKRYEIMMELFLECLILTAQIFLCIYVIPKTMGFLWPFVAGWLIALMVKPITQYLNEKFKISKKYVSAIILILLILSVGIVFYLLMAVLLREAFFFMQDMPSMYSEFIVQTKHIPELLKSYHLLPEAFQVNVDQLFTYVKELCLTIVNKAASVGINHAGSIASNIIQFLIGIIVSILSAYFFVIYKEKMKSAGAAVCSAQLQQRIMDVYGHIKNALGGYILAQFKLMGIVFMILAVGLTLSGNPYSIFIAFLIAVVDIIPFLGTGFVLIPWAVFDFITGSYSFMILRFVLYIICLLARQLLQPKIIGDSVGLNPFVTLLLIYIGFKIDGIRGFLLAMIFGIILLNFYKLGLFDKKIKRFRHLLKLLKEADERI